MIDFKVALITGATGGIGRKLAVGLAEDGYKTVLMARNTNKLYEIKNEIKEFLRDDSELIPDINSLDITNFGKLESILNEIKEKYGRIDVLINNAAVWSRGSLDLEIDEYKKVLETNLTAQYAVLKSVVPLMKERETGYIFNIASRGGVYGFAGSGSYSSSKFGLVGLSESLYRELADKGIKVTAICPSWVNTEMAQQADGTIVEEEMIQPDDILKTIRWLLDLSSPVSVKDVVLECRTRIK